MQKLLLLQILFAFAAPIMPAINASQMSPELTQYLQQKFTKEFEKQRAYELQRQKNQEDLKKIWNFTKDHKYQLLTGLGAVGLGVVAWHYGPVLYSEYNDWKSYKNEEPIPTPSNCYKKIIRRRDNSAVRFVTWKDNQQLLFFSPGVDINGEVGINTENNMQTEIFDIKEDKLVQDMKTETWDPKKQKKFLHETATKDSLFTRNSISNQNKKYFINRGDHKIFTFKPTGQNKNKNIIVDNNFKFGTAHWHPKIDTQLVTSYGKLGGCLSVSAEKKAKRIKILDSPEDRYANEVVLWEIKQKDNDDGYCTDKIATITTKKKRATGAFYSPDGKKLAIVSYNKFKGLFEYNWEGDQRPFIEIWDVTTTPKMSLLLIGAQTNLNSAIWSPDSSKIAVFNKENPTTIYIYDVNNSDENKIPSEDQD